MLVVPLQPVPAQQVTVSLAGQACQIVVRQTNSGVIVNVSVNNSLIVGGVLAEDRNRIVRSAWLGFIGDLAFFDLQGSTDPADYTEIGLRYQLMYITAAELAALGLAA